MDARDQILRSRAEQVGSLSAAGDALGAELRASRHSQGAGIGLGAGD